MPAAVAEHDQLGVAHREPEHGELVDIDVAGQGVGLEIGDVEAVAAVHLGRIGRDTAGGRGHLEQVVARFAINRVGARDQDPVVASAAAHEVRAVAARQDVVAVIAVDGVVAPLARDQVVAGVAKDGVAAVAGEDGVVAVGAVNLIAGGGAADVVVAGSAVLKCHGKLTRNVVTTRRSFSERDRAEHDRADGRLAGACRSMLVGFPFPHDTPDNPRVEERPRQRGTRLQR